MNLTVADYTPIALQFIPEPLVTWADLRGVRFVEPSFRETLGRLPRERSMALTGIDELRALDSRPTLAPSLFIFQVSRCGSTLLSQMLATLATNVVIAEANVINAILAAHPAPPDKIELVRLVIRAMGRNCARDARHLIVKFTSWNVLSAEMIHRAFPETPMVCVQREPIKVVASQADQPAGWTRWQETEAPALSMFGLTVDEARGMNAGEFRLHAIEALYRAVHAARLPWQMVDYAELPEALWERIGKHARISWNDSEIERMRERARFDSKTRVSTPFVAKDRMSVLSDTDRKFVAERIEPLYRAARRNIP